ncbi:hypothetical protein PSAB6_610033 [Paraburkholderia sabiae]|nr:hypothetical protein PSAB6_610033 [Paraburkholderia sabiae]
MTGEKKPLLKLTQAENPCWKLCPKNFFGPFYLHGKRPGRWHFPLSIKYLCQTGLAS